VGPGRSSHPIRSSVRPLFLEHEDDPTLSRGGRRHSEETEPYTREVVHKAERLDRERIEEIIREKDSSSTRRQPQAEEDVEALP
jgi:hypothetical protein